MDRREWNILWSYHLGADHELVPTLCAAGKCSNVNGYVTISANDAEEWADGLQSAVRADWLEPTSYADDGSLRTRLKAPAGLEIPASV